MVLCCLFWCQSFGDVSPYVCSYVVFLSVMFGLLSGLFWEIAAHSVDHMFSLYFDYLYFFIFQFGFEGWIWVLIASVPGLCIFCTCN